VTLEELPAQLVEPVARAIHERYRVNQAGRKHPDDPALADWDELPEQLRRSNRAQGLDILPKLRAIGHTVRTAPGGKARPIALSEAEVERLAILEHRRWTADRLADGWTPGERDVSRSQTPDLVAWDELTAEEQEWDREAVRAIPEVLAGVGLEIGQ
jgi:RyR domain